MAEASDDGGYPQVPTGFYSFNQGLGPVAASFDAKASASKATARAFTRALIKALKCPLKTLECP